MFLLEKSLYHKARLIFEKRLSFEMPVKTVFNEQCGRIYVDNITSPKSSYVELEYGFYYFGGEYNQPFINSIMEHIMTDIIPLQTLHDFAFIFADSEILKTEVEKKLNGIKNNRGKRCYYMLYAENFTSNLYDYNNLPENYELKIDIEKGKVIAIYNSVEVGYCGSGGADKKTLECDVFLKDGHRKKGIGTLMCAKFIEYNLFHGYDKFTWGCWEGNVPSCRLAEKLGFKLLYVDEAIIATVK